MKVIGKTTWLTEEADLFMQMEIFMKEIGEMTKLMDLENTLTQTVLSTRESGWMTSSMDWARRDGLMELSMKEITN
jgi:hypothetical protein